MVRKILGMTDSCKECANRAYYSGRMHVCRLVDEVIHAAHEHEVAPFCPLPDYPSKTIAGQQATIFGLREPHAGSLGLMLLTHIATKLNLALEPSACGVTIPFKDMKKDREAYLGLEYISEIAPLALRDYVQVGRQDFQAPSRCRPAGLGRGEGCSWRALGPPRTTVRKRPAFRRAFLLPNKGRLCA